jgi:hypothetical protein
LAAPALGFGDLAGSRSMLRSDLVLKDDKAKRAPKPKRPRNRRHGRSR